MERSLEAELRAALPPALKAGDRTRVAALRTTLAALANAEAVDATGTAPAVGAGANEVARRELSADDAARIVAAERDDLRATAAELHGLDRATEAAELRARAAVLDDFLAARP